MDEGSEPNDIDLAVGGIRLKIFFKFYGELMRKLSKPVDIVDLSRKSLFNQIIGEKELKSMDELLREVQAEKEYVLDTFRAALSNNPVISMVT